MKKIHNLITLTIISLIFVTGCNKNKSDEEVIYAVFDKNELIIPYDSVTKGLELRSRNAAWELKKVNGDWITLTNSSNETLSGPATPEASKVILRFKFTQNPDTLDRTAQYLMTYKKDTLVKVYLDITQSGETNLVKIDADTMYFTSAGGSITRPLVSNIDWNINILDDSWLSYIKTKAYITNEMTFTAEPNSSLNYRQTVVNVNSDRPDAVASKKIVAYQFGTGSIMSDSLALVDLYNSTKGASWSNKWDLSKPVSKWYGVQTGYTVSGFRVISLDLAANNLEGSIPSSIGDLDYLEILGLQQNKLSGEIPASIGSMQYMRYLYLYENDLSGEIPSSLVNLKFMVRLHLGSNNLSGEIPQDLHLLSRLKILGLENNNLGGELPEELGKLLFDALIIHSNQFVGKIPTTYLKNANWKRWSFQINICPQQVGYGFDNCPGV